jgi:hypothetical protein
MLGAYYFLSRASSHIITEPLNNLVGIINQLLYKPIDPNINKVYLNKITADLKLKSFIAEEWNTIALGVMKIFLWGSYAYGSNGFGLISD